MGRKRFALQRNFKKGLAGLLGRPCSLEESHISPQWAGISTSAMLGLTESSTQEAWPGHHAFYGCQMTKLVLYISVWLHLEDIMLGEKNKLPEDTNNMLPLM